MRLGKYEDALIYIDRVIAMKGRLADSASYANSIDTKGAIYEAKKDYANAILNYEASFKIHDKFSPPIRKAEVYDNMGRVYGILGNELALGCILKAIYIRRELGDKRGLGSSYRSIAQIYAQKGSLDKAFEYAKQALALCDETHETLIKAEVLAFLGGLYIQKQDYGQAAIHEGRALQIAEPLNATNTMVSVHKYMGEIYAAQQDYPNAIAAFEKSLALIDKADFDAKGAANERKAIATRLVSIGNESRNRDIVRRYESLAAEKDK
jgi:tetratricopeptide (TPR) repeat protein